MMRPRSHVSRHVPWSLQTLMRHGAEAQWGWAILGIALIVVWRMYPIHERNGWIAVGCAAFGACLILYRRWRSEQMIALLRHGLVAGGRLSWVRPLLQKGKPTGKLEAAYTFTTPDGTSHRAVAEVALSLRLAKQALYALVATVSAALTRLQGREGSDSDHPDSSFAVQQLAQEPPLALLNRIRTDGWNAVQMDYLTRIVGASMAASILAAQREGSDPIPASTLDPDTVARVLGEKSDALIARAHDHVADRISETHVVGQFARGVLAQVKTIAQSHAKSFLEPEDETICYDVRRPDAYPLVSGALPCDVEVRDDGRLRGGHFLKAIAVSLLPTLVVLGHVIYALVRCWP